MLLDALLVNGLLGNDIASAEEHGSGDSLGEEGPAGESSLVPVGELGVSIIVCIHEVGSA